MSVRVLLMTTDPSLGAALAFDDLDREIVPVNSISDARTHDLGSFDVAVVDVGSRTRGDRVADLLTSQGTPRCLVIGDPPDEEPRTDGPRGYLNRPFTMIDLETTLTELVRDEGASRGIERRASVVGRLFESWTAARASPNGEITSGGPSAVETPAAAASSEVCEILPHDPGRDPEGATVQDLARMQEDRTLLAAARSLSDQLNARPEIANLEEITGRFEDAVTDDLAARSVSVWLQRSDGSHVRLHAGGRPRYGPATLDPDHPLVKLLATQADALLVVGSGSELLRGLEHGAASGAVAASLRTPERYHGLVIAFGDGLDSEDRDRLVHRATLAAASLALAATLRRLGVGDRLFTIPDIERTGQS